MIRPLFAVFIWVALQVCVNAEDTTINLHGILLDEITEQPLAGVTLYGDERGTRLTESAADGTFVVTVPADKKFLTLVSYRVDVVGKSVKVEVKAFSDKPIRIVVERGQRLEVQVRDEKGGAIPNAQVRWSAAGGASAKTDVTGNVMLGMVSRFREGRLSISCPGYKDYDVVGIYAPFYAKNPYVATLVAQGPASTDPGKKDEPNGF